MYIIIFWLVKKLHDVKGKQFVTAFTKSFPQFYSVCKITSKYTSVIALYLIHKVEMIFCSFLFVCLFVPYTNPHFWTSLNQTLHTSPPSSGRDRRVCMVRKCLTLFYFFDLLRRERVQNPGHNMAAGARNFRYSVMSVILADVSVTSHCSRRHLPRVIRDSVISVILAGVSVTSRKWRCSGRHLCAFLLEVSCAMGNA